jgi:hypothetical protein
MTTNEIYQEYRKEALAKGIIPKSRFGVFMAGVSSFLSKASPVHVIRTPDPRVEATTMFTEAVAKHFRSGAVLEFIQPTQTSEWWAFKDPNNAGTGQLKSAPGSGWFRFDEISHEWVHQTEGPPIEVQKSGACWIDNGSNRVRWNPHTSAMEDSDPPPGNPRLDYAATIESKNGLAVLLDLTKKYGDIEAIPESESSPLYAEAVLNRVSRLMKLDRQAAAQLIVKAWDARGPDDAEVGSPAGIPTPVEIVRQVAAGV